VTTIEITKIARQLDTCESYVLQWLAREKTPRYRQCSGRTLDDLIGRGLVQVGEDSQARLRDALVWLTPLGKQVLAHIKEAA
jgi:hypothetical protein